MNVSILKSVLLAILSTMLVACGKSADNKNTKTYDFDSNKAALDAAARWKVICTDPKNCPDSVAQLVVVQDSKASVCTATLIGSDVVATNSHCFDWDNFASPQTLCESGAFLVFASESASGREVARCKTVLTKSVIESGTKKNFNNPDYMLLKLDRPVARKVETVDTQGLDKGLKLQIKKVDPAGMGLGFLKVDQCEVHYGTFLMPAATHKLSPVHVLSGCQVISGNSGSSLFDSRGNIRGLIFAAVMADKLGIFPDSVQSVLRTKKPSFATNGACVDWELRGSLQPACSQNQVVEDRKIEAETLAKIQAEADVLALQNPLVGYSLAESESTSTTMSFIARPACYKTGAMDQLLAHDGLFSASAAVWKLELALNSDLQFTLNTKREDVKCNYTAFKSGPTMYVQSYDSRCVESKGSFSFTGATPWGQCQ